MSKKLTCLREHYDHEQLWSLPSIRFVYLLKITFYLPPRITCCLFLWTTLTYSPFQHITIDYICHTHRLLIIMAKTNCTNPHSEEPIRRSNRTAGKSPASEQPAARNPRHFSFRLKDYDDKWEVRVKRINVTDKREEVVTLLKEPVNGSHFGTCTDVSQFSVRYEYLLLARPAKARR